MTCARARRQFSEYRDQALPAPAVRLLTAHLETCAECARSWRRFNDDLDLLAEGPRVPGTGEIASRVFDRLDMESRQPGLALLFRPFGAARPLMLPSLVPAMFVLLVVVTGALVLDRGPAPPVIDVAKGAAVWESGLAPSGTESNPLFPTSEVSTPRVRSGQAVPRYLLDHPGEGTLFLETVVARDGTVSAVNVLSGDTSQEAGAMVDALRRERYEPGRFRGRPVAVSIYRLISRMEVWGT